MFCFQVSKSRWTVRSNHDVDRRHDGVAEARSEPRLALREERHLAEPLRLPDREREERGSERDGEEAAMPPKRRASRNASSGPPRKSAFAGFSASATPANVPASDGLAVRAAPRARGR